MALGLLALVLAANAPFFQMPFFWDSFWIAVAAEHILGNGLRPVIPPDGWDYGHPILLPEMLALSWLLLGRSPWVSHAVSVVFAFLAVYYTYRVGRLLYGARTGVVASLLLLSFPLFRAQSSVVYLELPTAALGIMAVYFVLRGKTLLYLLSASAMVLTKATGVLLVPVVLLYLALRRLRLRPGSREPWPATLGDLALHSLPALALAGWFWYHFQATGWVSDPDNAGWLALPADPGWARLLGYLKGMVFSREGIPQTFLRLAWSYFGSTFLVGVLTLLVVVYSFAGRSPIAATWRPRSGQPAASRSQPESGWSPWGPPENALLLGLPILLQLALMASTTYMQRYLLPQYCLFFVLSARAMVGVLGRGPSIAAATAALAGVFTAFTYGWIPGDYDVPEWASPSTLAYVDYVRTHQAAAAFVETHYPGRTVLTASAEFVELALPVQGYVRSPQRIVAYAKTPRRVTKIAAAGGRPVIDHQALTLDDFDLFYYSGTHRDPDAPDVARRFQLPLIAEFGQNTEQVAIYGNPSKGIGLGQ